MRKERRGDGGEEGKGKEKRKKTKLKSPTQCNRLLVVKWKEERQGLHTYSRACNRG